MPGELGDEQTQQSAGYYERVIDHSGEWAAPQEATISYWKNVKPRGKMLMGIMKRLREQKSKENTDE